MANYDDLKLAVESLSGGKNTVVFDETALGGEYFPSIMVRIPQFSCDTVLEGATTDPHPMFLVGGTTVPEILISKYQNIIHLNRAYSLPFRTPESAVSFDVAKLFCENKGAGWHLTTNAEYAGLALWCQRAGVPVRGHTGDGGNSSMPYERGTLMNGYTATGSGPAAWNHDGAVTGVSDLVGNVWEWAAGLRLKNGEIQIIPDNDAAQQVDQSASSSLWKAINGLGILVSPGITGTLKFDSSVAGSDVAGEGELGGSVILRMVREQPNYTGGDVDDEYRYQSCRFDGVTSDAEIVVPLTMLKLLGLLPAAETLDGKLFVRNYGDRMALRGGACDGSAGLFALNLMRSRASKAAHRGFRAAYVKF